MKDKFTESLQIICFNILYFNVLKFWGVKKVCKFLFCLKNPFHKILQKNADSLAKPAF